jgi:translation initiation factor 4E
VAAPPVDSALTTENLEKLNISDEETGDKLGPEPAIKKESKFPRGYKNIPSLDAITQRMRKTRTLSIDGSAMPSPGGTGLPGIGADESQLDKIEEFMKQRDLEEQRNNEHPLQYKWTLYHDSKPKVPPPSAVERTEPWTPPPTAETNAYEAQLTVVGDFKTVESFCRYMNWLKPPSTLERNSNYHLFKDKIKPMWEDEANANGGKWVITMRNNPQLLDRCWSYLTMAMVGEELEDTDEISGAGSSLTPPKLFNDLLIILVVSLRAKVDRIQLWTRSKTDVERLNGIAKKMIGLLGVSEADNVGLEFQVNTQPRYPFPITKIWTRSITQMTTHHRTSSSQ